MELYEQYAEEQISLKDYLARKKTCMEKTAAYQQKIQEIEAKNFKRGGGKTKGEIRGAATFCKI